MSGSRPCLRYHGGRRLDARRVENSSPARDRVGDADVADAYRTGLTIHAESIDVDVTLRGTAEALLLWLWGRIDIAAGELDVDGDRSVVTRWTELLPTS